jgi:hypothetical protein
MLTFSPTPAPAINTATNISHPHLAAVVTLHTLGVRDFDALATANDRVAGFLLSRQHSAQTIKEDYSTTIAF